MAFALLAYVVGVFGTLALVIGALTYLTGALMNRRRGPVLVPAGIVCGYLAGTLLVWSLVPRDWTLPFWTTLAATVNAQKYGDAVEHSAEGIVIAMMFSAVVGAVLGGLSTHIAGRLVSQRRAG